MFIRHEYLEWWEFGLDGRFGPYRACSSLCNFLSGRGGDDAAEARRMEEIVGGLLVSNPLADLVGFYTPRTALDSDRSIGYD